MHCGRLTVLSAIPARCNACGSGTGVIRPLEARDNAELLQSPTSHVPNEPTPSAIKSD
jgi:hypothetical protein